MANDPFAAHLWALRSQHHSVAQMARTLGLHRADLSRALNNAVYPPRLLSKLGWERVVSYRPVGQLSPLWWTAPWSYTPAPANTPESAPDAPRIDDPDSATHRDAPATGLYRPWGWTPGGFCPYRFPEVLGSWLNTWAPLTNRARGITLDP